MVVDRTEQSPSPGDARREPAPARPQGAQPVRGENPRPDARALLMRWLQPDGAPWGRDPADWDAGAVLAAKQRFDVVFGPRRYLRVTARGWEHLPDRPAMFVSNHSGGTTLLDALGFGWAWTDHFGAARPLHAMVHDLLLCNSFTGASLARVGALRASRANARRVLSEFRRDLVVYPGGDLDTWRPWGDRYRVCFGGRKGYARIALEAGVPVVPVAHAGAHESLVVLATGRRIARLAGIHRIARADVWPVHLSLPWGLAVGPMPHLPLPVRFDYRVGPAVPFPGGHRPGCTPSPTMVEAYDSAVREALQAELDALYTSRRRFVRRWAGRLLGRRQRS